jgi:hypothetical protein
MAAMDIFVIALVLFCVAIGIFIASSTSTTVLTAMKNAPEINESAGAIAAINSSQLVIDQADYWYFAAFIALCLGLIVSGWFIGGHPVFMIVYFLVIVVSVIISAVLSNAWETLSTNPTFILTIVKFPLMNNVLMNLPIYISIVGFIGFAAMFAKPMFAESAP